MAGPDEYTYREIVEFVSDLTGNKANMVDMPSSILSAVASVYELFPRPMVTQDIIERMSEDNVLIPYDHLRTFEDLGIVPGSLEDNSFDYLHRFRPGGHFKMVEGYYATDADRLRRDADGS